MVRFLLPTIVITACAANPPGVPPLTGEVRRYAVDKIDLVPEASRVLADDLNGDSYPDNNLGPICGTLQDVKVLSTHGPDMIASGVIASSVQIQADDFVDDPSVGVRYLGRDDADSVVARGALMGSIFASDRTRATQLPGAATVRLPIFSDADPLEVPLIGVEIDLTGDGHDGFDGVIRGGIPQAQAMDAAYVGVTQMIAFAPFKHLSLLALLDRNRDWTVSRAEFDSNDLVQYLLAADITLLDEPTISAAFRVHIAPCDGGSCSTEPPADHCGDRVQDGDESDRDCGGSCASCIGTATCNVASDCETRACDQGRCRAPSCDDGVRDGLETDVDCGTGCGPCQLGMQCHIDSDCVTMQCGEPCTTEPWLCHFNYLDTCR